MAGKGREGSRETRNTEQQLLALRAKERNRLFILCRPNVIGLDVGYRVRGGETTDESVVIAYVSQKVERELLRDDDLVPTTVRVDDQEVPVDVVQFSIPQPGNYSARSRPLRGGNSIGPSAGGGGTCGICVAIGDNTYILSNNHVLAPANTLPMNSDILQPSFPEGGSPANDVIANVVRLIPIDFGSTTITVLGQSFTVPNPNDVDAGLALVQGRYDTANREIHWIGYPPILGASPFNLIQQLTLTGMRVCKMGARSEFTTGTITSPYTDVTVGPFPGAGGAFAFFRNQIQITGDDGQPFSQRGDSGSLVVSLDAPHVPVGLLFTAPLSLSGPSFANPIQNVMNALGIPRI